MFLWQIPPVHYKCTSGCTASITWNINPLLGQAVILAFKPNRNTTKQSHLLSSTVSHILTSLWRARPWICYEAFRLEGANLCISEPSIDDQSPIWSPWAPVSHWWEQLCATALTIIAGSSAWALHFQIYFPKMQQNVNQKRKSECKSERPLLCLSPG